MERITVVTGKQGPAFGDRPSYTVLTIADTDGSVFESRVGNWPRLDRSDALCAAFEQFEVTGALADWE